MSNGTGLLSDYTVTLTSGTLTVNKYALSYTIGNDSQTYGTAANLATDLGATIATGVNNENLDIAYSSTGDTATAHAGTYDITGALSNGTGLLSDYTVTLTPGTLTVNKYALSYTIGNDSQTYGTAADLATDLGATIATGVNNENLDIAYSSTGDTNTAAVGGYDITGTLSNGSGLARNYDVTLNKGTLTVNTYDFTYTIGNDSQTYGTAAKLAADLPGTITTGVNGETLDIAYSSTGDTNTAAVGGYDITGTLSNGSGLASNYDVTLNKGTLTVNQASTTTTLSPTNPIVFGQSVTFTATVAAVSPGSGTPTGTVNFLDGTTTIGTDETLNSSGVATFSTSSLPAGTDSITAVYSGDPNFTTSTSSVLSQVVLQASSTTLTSGTNPSVSGQSVTFTATVAASSGAGTPTGTVNFLDGTTTIGTGTLSSGVATFSTSSLAVGTQSITAVYSGDTNFTTSTSSALSQVVNTPATLNQVLVDEDYRVLLNRAAEPGGLTYWSTQLNNGATPNSVGMAIANSTESQTDIVTNDYQNFLNRAPDSGGLAFWLGQLQSGRTPDQVAAGILGSAEYFADNGSTNQGFVSALYQSVLGSTPDSGGNAFWLNALASGVSRTQVAFDFLTSPEAAAMQVTSADYSGILNNRSPDTGGLNFWVTTLTGPSPSLTNQQVTVDFIDSAANINRIDTAIAQMSDATVDQIAMSLLGPPDRDSQGG